MVLLALLHEKREMQKAKGLFVLEMALNYQNIALFMYKLIDAGGRGYLINLGVIGHLSLHTKKVGRKEDVSGGPPNIKRFFSRYRNTCT
jgi:hypothetical protein